MKSIKQPSSNTIALSNKVLSRDLLYLVAIHVFVGMAAMAVALNVNHALLLA
jgi:hypothetical protein